MYRGRRKCQGNRKGVKGNKIKPKSNAAVLYMDDDQKGRRGPRAASKCGKMDQVWGWEVTDAGRGWSGGDATDGGVQEKGLGTVC